VYGTLSVSTSPLWPKIIAAAGVDFVMLDTEHIPLDRERLSWMCQTYAALGVAPVVRISRPDPYLACMALDGGAQGIIAPYVESAEEVMALRGAVKLRPLKGARLRSVMSGAEEPTAALAEFLARVNADNVLIANIESVPAIDALDEILDVPGLDACLVGPQDLTTNLGVPQQYRHPLFEETVRILIRKARARHVGVGVHCWFDMESEVRWAETGANLILHGLDLAMIEKTLRAEFRSLREALGDECVGEDEGGLAV